MNAPQFQLGDVVLFLQPHTDGRNSSRHPGLIVGDPLDNINRDYIIAQISSSTWKGNTDVVVAETDPDFKATGLDHGSTIRCHKIFPVAPLKVQRKLGTAGPVLMARVKQALRTALQL